MTPLVIFVGDVRLGRRWSTLGASSPPDDAMPIYVVGKQWMWKFQHPEGQREINALHVPVGRPVKLLLTSEDVIHSFFVPAFRIHMDVLPRPLHVGLVPGDAAGHVSPVLLAILRHESCGHDRQGRRHGAGRIPALAATRRPRARWRCRAARCFSSIAASVATAPTQHARAPVLEDLYRPAGAAARRPRRDRRRELHPRIDPRSRARRSWPASRTSCRPSRAR